MTKAERTRQFIIEKSAPIFNTKGVAATAMSDIMQATKLAKGSLYVHFENKEDLCYSAVDYNLDCLVNEVRKEVGKHKTAKAQLFAVIDFLTDPLNPPVVGGCPMLNFGIGSGKASPVILEKVNKVVQGMQQNLIALITKGVENGEFKGHWNAKDFALKAFVMIEGAILVSTVSGSSQQMKIIVKMIKREIEENRL